LGPCGWRLLECLKAGLRTARGVDFLGVFVKPVSGLVDLVRGEVTNLGSGEWLAKGGHSLLPRLITYECDAVDVAEMAHIELYVLPDRTGCPTVEIVHDDEESGFLACVDEGFELGKEGFVVFFPEFSGQFDFQQCGPGFLSELNRHKKPFCKLRRGMVMRKWGDCEPKEQACVQVCLVDKS
jgi:hypothetical protein